MRTSGAQQDTVLYAIPLVVLVVVAVTRFGGLAETTRLLNDTILSVIGWVRGLL